MGGEVGWGQIMFTNPPKKICFRTLNVPLHQGLFMQTPPLLSGPHNFLLYGSPHNTHIQLYTSTAATVNILINLLIVIEPKFVSSNRFFSPNNTPKNCVCHKWQIAAANLTFKKQMCHILA